MRRVNPNGVKVLMGVDLNRNQAYNWGSSGSSDVNALADYRGPTAGSEPESQALDYAMKTYLKNDGYSVYMNTHCGMHLLGSQKTTATNTKILANIKTIADRTGATTLSTYPPGTSCGGGYVCGLGGYYTGGNGWIHETAYHSELPPTLQGYLNKFYKQDFPIYLGMAQAVQR